MGAYTGVTMNSNGNSSPIIINFLNTFNPGFGPPPSWGLGLICTVSNGASLTYAVQVTADPVPSANGNWNAHDTVTGETASINGNVAYPVTGVRLSVTNYSSGTVHLGVAQWP